MEERTTTIVEESSQAVDLDEAPCDIARRVAVQRREAEGAATWTGR